MHFYRLTVCDIVPEGDTCVWAGVDSAWEQEKLEARKMLENAAESHTSGARFVGTLLTCKTHVVIFQATFSLRLQIQHHLLLALYEVPQVSLTVLK